MELFLLKGYFSTEIFKIKTLASPFSISEITTLNRYMHVLAKLYKIEIAVKFTYEYKNNMPYKIPTSHHTKINTKYMHDLNTKIK